ncbi:hypothetical protein GCM10027047_33840 [Rhodococcus aerolatus]
MTTTWRPAAVPPPPVAAAPVAGRGAVLRRRLATTTAVTASLLSATTAVALASEAYSQRGVGNPVSIGVGFVLALTASVLLVWRYRWPWVVLGVAVAAPVLGIADALAALVCLVGLVRVQPPRRAALAVAAVLAAVVVSLSWDAARSGPGDSSLLLAWRGVDPATPYEVALPVAWLVAAVLVGLTVGLGLLLRTTSALAVAERTTRQVSSERTELREEVVRAQERARLARDVHDGLSTLLTRISLHAGALQVRGYDGLPAAERAEVVGSAELIWDTAHEANDALARAVGALRGPGEEPGLDEAPAVVAGARGDGLRAVLTLDVAPGAGATSSRVALRVLREALGNAVRYAGRPEAAVRVVADPARGVAVEVRSPLPRRPPASRGTGTGLAGLAEVVHAAGGRFDAGPAGADFVVTAQLPWSGNAASGGVGPRR